MIQLGKLDEAQKSLPLLSKETPHADAERLALQGELLFHERKDKEAEEAFRNALRDTPSLGSAHYGLSTVLAERDENELATIHAHFAWGTEKSGRTAAQLGYCQLRSGNLQAAEMPLRQAVRLDPLNATAWNNLGIVLSAKQQQEEARACFTKALALKPDLTSASEHLARTPVATAPAPDRVGPKRPPSPAERVLALAPEIKDEAISSLINEQAWQDATSRCEELLFERPDDEVVAIALLYIHEMIGDIQSGIDALSLWLEEHPAADLPRRELGLAMARAQDAIQTEKWLAPFCQDHPEDVEALKTLSIALSKQERYEDALTIIDRALTQSPEDLELQGIKAGTLCNACRYEEALPICERLQGLGFSVAAHGPTLTYLGRLDEALALIDEGLKLQPNDPNLRMFRGQIELGREQFAEGWKDYAYRTQSNNAVVRALPFPMWRGEPLRGKKIIVLAEQGIGDQIMFASCIPDLLALGPTKVIIEALDRVAPTLARSFPTCEVIPTRQNRHIDWVKPYSDVDYFVPIGDLPLHFRPTRGDFPNHTGYVQASKQDQSMWHRKIGEWESAHGQEPGRRPRIGFSWKGGTSVTRKTVRTLESTFIGKLRSSIDATWVCLQYGDIHTGLEALTREGIDVAYWPESISDLDQFTSLISGLDLVVTVCNSTVHYAGALGTPVWVLTPKIPEWRYGLTSNSMPWYPSSIIVRQNNLGEWNAVLQKIENMLKTWRPARRS